MRDKARPLWNQAGDRVESIVGAAQDITSRRNAEGEARRGRAAAEELLLLRQEQTREARAQGEVSAALAGTLDPGTVYQVILEQAARVLPFDHAEISLYKDGWVLSVATLGGPRSTRGRPRFGSIRAPMSGLPWPMVSPSIWTIRRKCPIGPILPPGVDPIACAA